MKRTLLTFFLVTLSEIAAAQSVDSSQVQTQRDSGNHRMDRFIDLDGDGICDHRSQGLGFRRKRNPESMKNSSTCMPNPTSMTKGKHYRGGKQ